MRVLMLLLVVAIMSGCGNVNSCEGVDTSQAPTSISHSSTYTTYYWGDCSRVYPNK
jgi:uncharacterized protein YceK